MRTTFRTILIIILSINSTLHAQNFQKVDSIVRTYPKSFVEPQELADLIKKDFTTPEEKARAIFAWIAINIDYDLAVSKLPMKQQTISYSTEEEKEKKIKALIEKEARTTIRKGWGICHQYSKLYKHLSDLVSLECEIIGGYARNDKSQIGEIPSGHAWNAVKINNEWKLLDATWAADCYENWRNKRVSRITDFYFFTDPEKLVLTHYPQDTTWLFTDMTFETYINQPFYTLSYFRTGVELVEPITGIIKLDKDKMVKVKFKNIKNQDISFAFETGQFSIWIKPKIEDDVYVYEDKYKGNKNTRLIVSINSAPCITYKIVR